MLENIIENIRSLFRLKKETNDARIKVRIIRDIRNFFEHEEDCWKLVRDVIFGLTILLNIKVKAIEKHCQLKNFFIKLDHT